MPSCRYEVVIVGAGPAVLSAAIRLKQLSQQYQQDVSVCILEKGSEVGAHILSGNVFEPRALDELLPNWRNEEVTDLSTPKCKTVSRHPTDMTQSTSV